MKGDKTTTLALIAAAVILAVVGIKSFQDYKMAELAQNGDQGEAAGAETTGEDTETPPNAIEAEEAEFQSNIDQMPRSVLPPIPPALLTENTPSSPAESERQTEVEMYRARLEQLRAQGQGATPSLTSDPGRPSPSGSISGGGSLPPMPAELRGAPAIDEPDPGPIPGPDIPGSAVSAVSPIDSPETGLAPSPAMPNIPTGPDGTPLVGANGMPLVGPLGDAATPAADGTPPPVQTAAEIAALEDQVRRQPALAKVMAYDPEWAVLVLSSGEDSNIKQEMRFAVRRGVEILGFIKITEVHPTKSIAELMSSNKHSPTARKPQPGDDIIAFNLF